MRKWREGNFVKVKDGSVLESGAIANGWAGKIAKVFPEDNVCLIELDTPTLETLDEDYLIFCLEQDFSPYFFPFSYDDLELGKRRDTDAQIIESIKGIETRMMDLSVGVESALDKLKESWIMEFSQSPFFEDQSDYQEKNAESIVDIFMQIMMDFEAAFPEDWDPINVKDICLNIIPTKVSAGPEYFEIFGDVLYRFFLFLGSMSYIDNAKELAETLSSIKNKMAQVANDSDNWGMAKSLTMDAFSSGVDLENEEELKNYIEGYNESLGLEGGPGIVRPLHPDLFKGIGRNQRITVKYKNGDLVENIKFKKVEADLREGKCELVEI